MLSMQVSRILRRVVGLGLVSTLLALGARAQVTLANFVADANGYQNLKIGSANISDGYDNGTVNADPSKQSQLNGTNVTFDMVGNSTYSVIQVASGTMSGSGASAVAVRVRFAYDNKGFKAGGAIALFQNNSTVFGVGLSVTSNNSFTLLSLTSNPGTTLDAQYQFTVGPTAISTDSARYSYTQINAGTGGNVSATSDAFLTFVVLQSELQAISSGFSFGSTTGVSVFTNGGGNGLGSGGINMDFISSDNTLTGSLAFGSTSGSTVPIPEFSTAMILGVVLFPPIFLSRRRRRSATAVVPKS